MNWGRCVMICPTGSYTLTVDLMVDDDEFVLPNTRYFGEVRSMLNHVTPVVFQPENGIVDFGSHMEDELRYGNMYLHNQQVSLDEEFDFIWNDGGEDSKLIVDSFTVYGQPTAVGRGGRPRKDEAWTTLWLAIVELAQERRLNSVEFESQEALANELLEANNIGLSYDSIKPRISQLWNRLMIGQR